MTAHPDWAKKASDVAVLSWELSRPVDEPELATITAELQRVRRCFLASYVSERNPVGGDGASVGEGRFNPDRVVLAGWGFDGDVDEATFFRIQQAMEGLAERLSLRVRLHGVEHWRNAS